MLYNYLWFLFLIPVYFRLSPGILPFPYNVASSWEANARYRAVPPPFLQFSMWAPPPHRAARWLFLNFLVASCRNELKRNRLLCKPSHQIYLFWTLRSSSDKLIGAVRVRNITFELKRALQCRTAQSRICLSFGSRWHDIKMLKASRILWRKPSNPYEAC